MRITSSIGSNLQKIKRFFQSLPLHYILIAVAIIIILITVGVLLIGIETDDVAPSLEVLTKDTSVYEGEEVTIEVNFSDNDRVSSANLFYKRESDENFSKISIKNKTVVLSIPTGSGEDWVYYVTVNDPAKNGPVGDPSINGSKTYRIDVLRRGNGGDDSSADSGYKRAVFVEEFSTESCHNCPEVAESLHELFDEYKNGTYQFHYVTIIGDNTNSDTKSRIQEYNVDAYPIVFVDGGYETLYGQKEKLAYADAIQTASEKTTPDIMINLTASYNEVDKKIQLEIDVYNNESTEYTGRLRVYLAEVSSTKYQDADGETYKNAFLEFAINKDITVSANEGKTETKTLNTDTFDPENLMVYAVIFSKEKHQTYQDIGEQINPFDAYYVDGCVGVQVVEGGNLPPSINIEFPKDGKIYLFGKQIKLLDAFTFNKTFLIGRCSFTAQVTDSDGIEKVELYIDGALIQTFTTEPYNFTYKNDKIFKLQHTVRFVAYDTKGKPASSSLDIFALTL